MAAMTVGELLESIVARVAHAPSTVGRSEIDELEDELEDLVADALAEYRAAMPDRVVRMPKTRIAQLGTCERLAVAVADEAERGVVQPISEAMLAGAATDRFVAHQLLRGRVLEPYAALRSMLDTEGDWVSLEALDSFGEERMTLLLNPVAAAVANDWADVDDAWLPRVQSEVRIVLGDGAGVCRGSIDVELGGAGTSLPGVVIEVKSSTPRPEHAAETYLYALMVSLRDRRCPDSVARWYPSGSSVELPVGVGVLEAAALALGRAVCTWVELSLGSTPTESPGPWCRWCPDAPRCPSARHDDSVPDPLDRPPQPTAEEDNW